MIILKNINKSFHETKQHTFRALDNINLHIQPSECVVLKGISGSGKSTLLSIIGTLLKPSSGSLEIDGINILHLSDYHISHIRNKKIGYITQSFNLFEKLSVAQNIIPPLLINNLSVKQIEQKTTQALKLAEIFHKRDSKVSNLSGGEKQRTIIARALVNDPSIILCDEPTANLDKNNSLKFIEVIKKLNKLNKTILIATHDPLFENIDFVDRVLNISEGKIE